MAIYNYGIGGNEVKVDANESIAEIPSNRTLIVQKLTDEAPAAPESVYGLETIEDVFQRSNVLNQQLTYATWMRKVMKSRKS